MKKIKQYMSVLLALMLMMVSVPLPSMTVSAASVSDGLWEYKVIYEDHYQRFGEITQYNGEIGEETLTIPDEIDGVKIVGVRINKRNSTENGNYQKVTISEGIEYITGDAFSNGSDLSVTLPNTLKYIGKNAFAFSKNLQINFPEGLEGIDQYAFNGATFSDTKLTLPQSLKYLAYCSFASTNLTDVSLGKNTNFSNLTYAYRSGVVEYNDVSESTKSYDAVPFYNCNVLETIQIDSGNPYLQVTDNAVYSKNGRKLYLVVGDRQTFTMSDKVEKLYRSAFCSGQKIGTLTLSKNICEIPSSCFEGVKIETIVFPKNSHLKTIGDDAFYKASVSNEIVIPKSVVTIGSRAFQVYTPAISFEENSELISIGANCFADVSIRKFDFSNCRTLLKIGACSFKNNRYVEEIDLSDTLLGTVEQSTFDGCKNLKQVLLPDSVAMIEKYAFRDCPQIERVDCKPATIYGSYYGDSTDNFETRKISFVADTVTQKATEGDFQYREYTDYIEITGYTGDQNTDVVIPDEIHGKPVTMIGSDAFLRKTINSVVLPQHLERIGREAFSGCEMNKAPEFPNSLQYIFDFAFTENYFTDITLNEGLRYIGYYGFDCSSFENLNLPDSLVAAEYSAFGSATGTVTFGSRCRNIERTLQEAGAYEWNDRMFGISAIEVSDDNPNYSSENGVLYNKDKTELIYYPACKSEAEFAVPDSVQVIRNNAFVNAVYLEKIVFGSGLRVIEDNAFYLTEDYYCKNLNSIVFRNGADIDCLNQTFHHMASLETVVFEENVIINELIETFADTAVSKIHLPSSVRVLRGTFQSAPLQEISFEEGIQVIGTNAFRNTNLKKVMLPDSVLIISKSAFQNCGQLSDVNLGGTKRIASNAFKNCKSLEQIDLTGVSFAAGAFAGCDNLKKLYFTAEEKEALIAENEFRNNQTIKAVVIGSAVGEIQGGAFADCTNLETAYIADEVEIIDDTAFENCENLTIVCTMNSPAMRYAVRNHINYTTFIISPIPDQPYTGNAVKPSVTVSVGTQQLSSDDYSVQYTNNVNVGTARVTVAGKGDYSIYAATASFYIVKSNAANKNGWRKENGKWYYYSNGSSAKYWRKISGKWYYFNAKGEMMTGWLKSKGKWYYLTSSGAMALYWQKINGKWYYFNSNGEMMTGKISSKGKTYYFNTSGACINP